MLLFIGIKRTNLENLSTIVKIPSKPREDIGKFTMKSMETWSKQRVGFSKGYNLPIGFYVLVLFY